MPIRCLGCSLGHLTNFHTLIEEARKFERSGDGRMRDLHLAKALGEIRQSEEQCPIPDIRTQLRDIRKTIEASIAVAGPIPDVSEEVLEKSVRMIEVLRGRPELCPTCRVEVGPTHVASHRV